MTEKLYQKEFDILKKEIRILKREVRNTSLFRKKIYTIKDAAKVVGVSESYIQKLVSSREIPHSKPTGKLVFITRQDLDSFFKKNRIESNDNIDMIIANHLLKKR